MLLRQTHLLAASAAQCVRPLPVKIWDACKCEVAHIPSPCHAQAEQIAWAKALGQTHLHAAVLLPLLTG